MSWDLSSYREMPINRGPCRLTDQILCGKSLKKSLMEYNGPRHDVREYIILPPSLHKVDRQIFILRPLKGSAS